MSNKRGSGPLRLYKRAGSPYWWFDFVAPDGRRVRQSTRCRDREAAARIARERSRAAEHEAADALAGIDRGESIALVSLAASYIAHAEQTLAPSYVQTIRQRVAMWVAPYFGVDRDASTITTADVEAFRRWCLSGGRGTKAQRAHWRGSLPSTKTVNDLVVILRRILAFGVDLRLLPRNAADGVHALKTRTEAKFRALDADEVSAWVAHMPSWAAWWVRFAIATGLRRGEMAAVRWADIDREVGCVRIRPYRRADGTLWAPKGRRRRNVPLTRDAAAVLDEKGGCGIGPIFDHLDMRASFRTAWKAAGFAGRVPSPHDLRHTAASKAAQAGATLVELQAWFGWESPAVAARYLHDYGPGLSDLARRIDEGA